MRKIVPLLVVVVASASCVLPNEDDDNASSSAPLTATPIKCGALVVGGGLGGVAAAQELAAQNVSVCLTEETTLLGGTYTAEGTPIDSLFDDMAKGFLDIESETLDVYRARYPGAPRTGWFNPGDCWRRNCWEPSVGAQAIEQRSLPANVHVYKRHVPVAVSVISNRVSSVTFVRQSDGQRFEMSAPITIDATDLGDLYPLAHVGFRVGRDRVADFHEPHAYAVNGNDSGDPECVQRMTWVMALEKTTDDPANVIPRPPGYDAAKYGVAGAVFDIDQHINPSNPNVTWWNWRRYLAPRNPTDPLRGIPGARDVTSINMFGANDFAVQRAWCGALGCSPIRDTRAEQEQVFGNAKNHALGLVYFLQHDARRPDGRLGYTNIRLRPDAMGTADGMAAYPYIREGRRLRALRTVTENDMLAHTGPRFSDTIGINRYQIDVKGCPPTALTPAGEIDWHDPADTVPFMEIPYGALVPESVDGLLAGTSKNMGVSHIANGSLRIHPGEWNVGRAAGVAASIAIHSGVTPRQIAGDPRLLRLLQQRLVASPRSGPVTWFLDVPRNDRGFVAIQMMGASGVMGGYVDVVDGEEQSRQHPDATLTRAQAALVTIREIGVPQAASCHPSFTDVPCNYFAYGAIQGLADAGIVGGYADGTFRPGNDLTRAQLSKIIDLADCHMTPALCSGTPPAPQYSDVTPADWFYPFVAANAARGYYRGADANGATFGPNVPVTRREAAIWLYNHMRLRLGLD